MGSGVDYNFIVLFILALCFGGLIIVYVTAAFALGGLLVTCLPLDSRFASSNPAQEDGFLKR
jgi:hypothetical protein